MLADFSNPTVIYFGNIDIYIFVDFPTPYQRIMDQWSPLQLN